MTPRERFWSLLNRYQSTLIGLVLAIGGGVVLGFITPMLSQQNSYRLMMIVVAAGIGIGIFVTRQPKRIFVIAFILSIPLNLRFTPFVNDLAYHAGGAPPAVLIYIYDIPFLGLVALWIRDIMLLRKPIRFSAIDSVAIIFLLWTALSLFTAGEYFGYTVAEVIRLLKTYLAGIIISNFITSKSRLLDVLWALIIAILIQTMFAISQYFFNADLTALGGFTVGTVNRVSGTVGWPNTFGAWIAMGMAIIIGYWIANVFPRWNFLFFPVIALSALPLAISFSRGAWLALAVALSIIYALSALARLLRPVDFVRLFVIGIIALLAGLYFSGAIEERAQQDTVSVRYELSNIASRMIQDEPLIGIGVNTFTLKMPNYDNTGVVSYFREPVHNIYFLIGAENGVVGLALFLLMNGVAFFVAIRTILISKDRLLVATSIAFAGGLVVLLISNVADVHLKFDPILTLYWLILGMIGVSARMTVDWKLTKDSEPDAT
ncbi:MAG: O-antigen ligase family protein [Aggregatilineales bacterium]